MAFYGYKNTKINRLMGIETGGEWVKIGFIRYLHLSLAGYCTKTSHKRGGK